MAINIFPDLAIGAVAGAAVGFALSKLIKKQPADPSSPAAAKYCGKYYGCYYSTTGSGDVVPASWTIESSGGMTRAKVVFTGRERSFTYEGPVRARRGHIYANVASENGLEELFFMFPEPPGGKLEQAIGIITALTVDKKPFSTKFLLSSSDLAPQIVALMLKGGDKFVVEGIARPGAKTEG